MSSTLNAQRSTPEIRGQRSEVRSEVRGQRLRPPTSDLRGIAAALLLLALCAATASAAGKPSFTVYSAAINPRTGEPADPDCAQFYRDMENDRDGLRTSICRVFQFYERHRDPNCPPDPNVPVFVANGRQLFGYTNPADLLARLGIPHVRPGRAPHSNVAPAAARPPEPAELPAAAQQTAPGGPGPGGPGPGGPPPAAVCRCPPGLGRELAEVRELALAAQQAAGLAHGDLQQLRGQLDQEFAAVRHEQASGLSQLSNEVRQIAATHHDAICRQDALEQALTAQTGQLDQQRGLLRQLFDGIAALTSNDQQQADQLQDHGEKLDAPGRLGFTKWQLLGMLFGIGTTAAATVTGLGWLPVAGRAVLRVGGLIFRRRRRPTVADSTPPPAPAPAAPPIPAPAPAPAPQPPTHTTVIRPEVEYQRVEIDKRAAAWAWAKQMFALKHPNSADCPEILEHFMRQYESGEHLPKKAA